jgi:site-specific recombinase XerD
MRDKPIEPLSAAEFTRMVESTSSGAIGVRDRALLEVLLKAQLRIAEALSLVKSDYDPGNCTLMVRRGKGGKQRLAVLHHSATEALED